MAFLFNSGRLTHLHPPQQPGFINIPAPGPRDLAPRSSVAMAVRHGCHRCGNGASIVRGGVLTPAPGLDAMGFHRPVKEDLRQLSRENDDRLIPALPLFRHRYAKFCSPLKGEQKCGLRVIGKMKNHARSGLCVCVMCFHQENFFIPIRYTRDKQITSCYNSIVNTVQRD
jgi:hypothetical protein